MHVRDGRICLPEGVSYEVMVLPPQKEISHEVLEKIRQLVYDGATIIGPKPETSVGLYNYEETERRVKEIADLLWGKEANGVVDRTYGKVRIVC